MSTTKQIIVLLLTAHLSVQIFPTMMPQMPQEQQKYTNAQYAYPYPYGLNIAPELLTRFIQNPAFQWGGHDQQKKICCSDGKFHSSLKECYDNKLIQIISTACTESADSLANIVFSKDVSERNAGNGFASTQPNVCNCN